MQKVSFSNCPATPHVTLHILPPGKLMPQLLKLVLSRCSTLRSVASLECMSVSPKWNHTSQTCKTLKLIPQKEICLPNAWPSGTMCFGKCKKKILTNCLWNPLEMMSLDISSIWLEEYGRISMYKSNIFISF